MAVTVQYQDLLNAVESYYGRGSDQWAQIYTNGIRSDNAASILKQLPDVDLVLNKDGTVRDYSLRSTGSYNTAGTSIATQINSNVQAGTASATEAAKLNIPSVITSTTGTLTGVSGIGLAADTGLTVTGVMGAVSTGLLAVSGGIALGQTIDKVLYNANPDFWDSHNMSTLNPETWNGIIDADDNSVGANIVRAFFHVGGTDTDKNASMYIDENALAYATAYMGSRGAFESTQTMVGTYYFNPFYESSDFTYYTSSPEYRSICRITTTAPVLYNISHVNQDTKHIWGNLYVINNNDAAVTATQSYGGNVFETIILSAHTMTSVHAYYKDYYASFSQSQLLSDLYIQDGHFVPTGTSRPTTVTFTTASGVEGISQTPDAAHFDPSGITDWSNIDAVLNALKTQYPSLFTREVSKDVPQSDGTKTYNYVEVPIGQATSDTDNQPVSGTSTQSAPAVDTSASTELQELLKTLLGTTTYNNPPSDTGSGDTPTVVVPTGSASALYAVYNPTQQQLSSFGAWLWSADFAEQIKKLFNDPMQSIIGLHKIFCAPLISGSGNIKVGYLDSGVASNVVSDQYTTLSCGSVDLAEYFGNIFDYSPYTDISLYLPFIGIVRLNTADVMRSKLTVTYHFDILTGACLAEVKVTRDSYDTVLYQYTGNAAAQYPLSSGSYMGILSGILSIAGGIAGTVATGGAAAPLLVGSAASALSMRTKVERSGSLSGNAGAMGIKIPYLIISRPQTALADNYQNYVGIPANQETLISDTTGFVKYDVIHLTGVTATEKEKSEIQTLFSQGVLI